MKNKKMVYILMPVVLLIWGYIGFKIFNYGEDEMDVEPIRIDQIITDQEEKQTSKTLALNYADPFLKGIRNTSRKQSNREVSRKPKKVSTPVNWGDITYNGFIKNQKNAKKIALLNVNGKQSLAAKGDRVQQVSVVLIQQDSVLLEKESNRKWFRKFSQQ